MNLSRRRWFRYTGLGALSSLAMLGLRAGAGEQAGHVMTDGMVMPDASPSDAAAAASGSADAAVPKAPKRNARNSNVNGAFTPVRTPNGWTLPHRMVGGVKEFHLVAEEVEHEFAPGTRARCWGYNGSTPGPTIEAVEGDRVRIFVTNRLPEHTSVHWHGILLPSGMDGVGGLSQPHIKPGETFAYEFTLRQHGTHMYHPHADEMVQLAVGMMGMFIIHPNGGEPESIDRDYAVLLHNWALHPGTYRPDPSVMQNFDLWTFNSKVFPAIEPFVASRASACAFASAICPCGTTRSTCMGRASRSLAAMADVGQERNGAARSPRSSALVRLATWSSLRCPVTGPCTATCRTTP